MRKLLLSALALFVVLITRSQCTTNVNFNTWTVAGQPANGNWSVLGGGSSVFQSVNGAPAFFISPFDLMNVHVSGTFKTTDNDDDWMGFVFSFLNPLTPIDSFDCWLYDWKQQQQGGAASGMSLNRCYGLIPPSGYQSQFWDHTNTPQFTVVQNNFGSAGWNQGTNYNFDLYLTYTRATIFINGAQVFDWQDCYKPGRFGFYNYSQKFCTYSNFQYSLYIDYWYEPQICLGQSAPFNFIDPCVTSLGQYQSLTWNFGDGQTQVINNPTLANVNVTHTYAAAGVYTATLTVVDANGCSATATHNIDVRNPIVLNPTLNPPPCNGGSNGGVVLAPTQGFGNFQYNWSNGTSGSNQLVGATAGTYTVTVTDGVCNTTGQFTLSQPPPLTATTSHTDANCGLSNGTATIVISGGTPPYQGVNWGPPFPGATATGMGPGTYIADFHDANGCSSLLQYSETISSGPCGVTSSVTKTNVSCFNGNNGTATLNVTGSSPPVNIVWSNGATGATITGLQAGVYTFDYSDALAAHHFTGSVTITQPSSAMVAQLATTPISCAGSSTGQAIASVPSGGVAPYTYAWNPAQSNNPVASNLAPGPIQVTVTDANGCSASAFGSISSVPSLAVSFSTVIDSCFHSGKGSATAHVSGGTAPYSYSWNNFETDTANMNLMAGTYTITVTDFNGCSISASTTVTGPSASVTRTYTFSKYVCTGATTGFFNVIPAGGTPGYNYTWNPNTVSGNNPTGLSAGIYQMTISDAYGCSAIVTDTIREAATPLSATTSSTDFTCNGANDGTIAITIGGGYPPYSYQGTPVPAGTTTIPNLSAGIYSGTVTDSLGCSVTVNDTITEPAALTLTEVHTDVLCNGTSTGAIDITAVGGNIPYSYLWNDGVNTEDRSAVLAGNYTVTVTDNNSCTATVSAAIAEPAALSATEAHTDITCNGANDGTITITTTGGTPTNTYSWNDGVATQNRTGLAAGTFSVTVYDNYQCSATVSATITEPTLLTASETHTDLLCNGDNSGSITLTLSGGTNPASVSWNDGVTTQNRTGLAGGTYSVTITDNNNCTATLSAIVSEPTVLTASTTHTDATCNGATDGTITITVSGGTMPYNFLGNPVPPGTNTVPNLAAGTYAGNLTDANGCIVALSETITEPAAPVMTVNATDAICNGGNGTAVANPSGAGPFSFTWSGGGGNNQTITPPAGNYTVSATDASSCNQTAAFTINEPPAINIQTATTDVLCFGASTGSISLTVSGGTGVNYTYTWSPNVSSGNSASAVAAGSYDITVTDGNACMKTQNVIISEPADLSVSATATDATCFGASDGTITATATGGVNPYTYTINTQNGLFTGQPAGTYVVTVSDANACLDSTTATITEPTQITTVVLPTDVSCYHYTDGQINVTASGGASGYTYSLSTGAQNTSGQFSNLQVGNYTITVTDQNQCSTVDNAAINEPDSLTITVTPDPVTVNLGETIQLQTTTTQTGTVNYSWLPTAGLSCYDCASPDFSGINSVVYTVTMSTNAGCTGASTVRVNVVPNYTVFFPNAFTPNGDGANDSWLMFGNLPGIKQIEVKVFNRWGEKVFESTDLNFGWDGNFKGTVVPGVYSYTAKLVWLDNHTDNKYKGTITLLK